MRGFYAARAWRGRRPRVGGIFKFSLSPFRAENLLTGFFFGRGSVLPEFEPGEQPEVVREHRPTHREFASGKAFRATGTAHKTMFEDRDARFRGAAAAVARAKTFLFE